VGNKSSRVTPPGGVVEPTPVQYRRATLREPNTRELIREPRDSTSKKTKKNVLAKEILYVHPRTIRSGSAGSLLLIHKKPNQSFGFGQQDQQQQQEETSPMYFFSALHDNGSPLWNRRLARKPSGSRFLSR
jgi:hypothetical protein